MATATKLTKQVPTTTYKTADDGVSLRLTQAEALTVVYVLRQIGGAAASTARGHTQSVLDALQSAGIPAPCLDGRSVSPGSGIYFRTGSREAIDKLAGSTNAAQEATQAQGQQAAIGGLNAGSIDQYKKTVEQAAGQAKQAVEKAIDADVWSNVLDTYVPFPFTPPLNLRY